MSYPKWRYSENEARIFMTEEDEIAQGGVWFDTPTLMEESKGAGDERAQLLAQAEEKGIKIDKRWGIDKIREALDDNDN